MVNKVACSVEAMRAFLLREGGCRVHACTHTHTVYYVTSNTNFLKDYYERKSKNKDDKDDDDWFVSGESTTQLRQ